MKTDIQELLSLKEGVSATGAADVNTLNKLYLRAKECVSKRMEVLVASGLVDTTTFRQMSEKLEKANNDDYYEWRNNVLSSIETCLEKCQDHERMREAVES